VRHPRNADSIRLRSRQPARHSAEPDRAHLQPILHDKPTGSGTGLGLSISLGIVREHEARIWAETRRKPGARFVVEIPITEPRLR